MCKDKITTDASEQTDIMTVESTAVRSNLEDTAMSKDIILKQVQIIKEISDAVMTDGVHYGKIPGCGDKPTLLKPGAEKLLITFRLAAKYDVETVNMENNHREYEITCNLTSMASGMFVGSGVGECSTMEGKFRYRAGGGEASEVAVPKKYWDTRKQDPQKAIAFLKKYASDNCLDGVKFGTKKTDMGWFISVIGDEKVEHDNPADYYNTVKKIAKKRALVDAVLSCTGASDIFTQDVEDMNQNGVLGKPTQQESHSVAKTVTTVQIDYLRALLTEKKLDDAYITEQFEISKLEDLPEAKGNTAVKLIEEFSDDIPI